MARAEIKTVTQKSSILKAIIQDNQNTSIMTITFMQLMNDMSQGKTLTFLVA